MSGITDETQPDWVYGVVPLKLRLGEITIASLPLHLMRRSASLAESALHSGEMPKPPRDSADAEGFVVWAHPIAETLPTITWRNDKIVYVTNQYERYFIDLSGDYAGYLAKFSAKSRSTLKRKLRKFAEIDNGALDCREYRTVAELEEFYALARQVSETTYQERLLDAGLPNKPAFVDSMRALAKRDAVRAYLLFSKGEPVSYLYCPIRGGVLEYQYLGYAPSLASYSPGTVLQSLALESLFKEGAYRLFDFTGGEGDHKRFFSTGSARCADIYVINRGLRSTSSVLAHRSMTQLSDGIGSALDRFGLKARIRRFLRSR